MKIYCIGHKEPQYLLPSGSIIVTPNDLKVKDQLLVPDDYWGAEFDGKVLSEYLQLFVLASYLVTQETGSESILFCQYRKFLSLRTPAKRSINNPYSFVVGSDEATEYFPTDNELSALSSKNLFGPCIKLNRSLSSNYSDCHLVEDFIAFTHAMRDSGRFNLDRCKQFISFPYLMPAPSLGRFTASFFINLMSDLLLVWKVYQEHYFQARSGYQRRVGGFLLERLHSFLIVESILKGEIKEYVFANQLTVSTSELVELTI